MPFLTLLSFLFVPLSQYAVPVSATVMLYNDSLPSTLTSECSAALLTDVASCDPLVKNLRPDFFYPPTSLDRICTSSCASSLEAWKSSVQANCGNQTVVTDLEVEAAAVYLPGSLQDSFQLACLQDDSGRRCGPVAALAAAFADPGISPFNYISNVTEADQKPDACDACLAERLRLRAGSPYFDGPIIASESLYESVTASCHLTGLGPVSTTTLGFFTATPTPTASACQGSTYTVQAADDCYSISKSQGVGTAWLLADNNLEAYCAKFPAPGTELCITNECKTVTVGVNATCADVAAAANITETQFKAWNPAINAGCMNLNTMNGSEVCVAAPGRKFVAPTGTSALPPMTPTAPATTPSDAADGSGGQPCGQWYLVQTGDYCNLLTLKFGISVADFLFLNTGVNANCTNLFAAESYCVAAVGDINTYSGRPGYMSVTLDPSATITGVPFNERPDATESPYSRLYTPLPIATDTRDDCVHYFAGEDYQVNTTGSTFASPCVLAATVYDVDLDSFASWNPGLGNVTDPSCAFQSGVRYCGSWYLQKPDQLATATATETATDTATGLTPPGPTMSGEPADCNKWAVVRDGVTCTDMANTAGISLAQFLAWNPAVSSDCTTNYWLGEAYCVGVSGFVSATTPPPTTTTTTAAGNTSPTPPGPTMSGEPANCNKWAVVIDGVTCTDMANTAGISLAQFLAWNPAVSSDCTTNYWLGEAYCVGVSSSTTTTSTSAAPAPTVTKPPAEYLQSGQPENCDKWDRCADGDYCDKLASRNGLTVSHLAALNPAFGTNGANCGTQMWLGYYYCVAVN